MISKLPWKIDTYNCYLGADWHKSFCVRMDLETKTIFDGPPKGVVSTIPTTPLQQQEANAAFIVKACNYHQDLMDLCRNLLTDNVDVNSAWNLLDEIERTGL